MITYNEPALRKQVQQGTHRLAAPEETLARVRPWCERIGITRVANVTWLDRIGIPVAMAVRPNSRSVSVAQGKGQTLELAYASAVMEAVETWHGEELGGRVRFVSWREMAGCTADPALLCRTGRVLAEDTEIGWIEGRDLRDGSPVWLPAELIHTDYTIPPMRGAGYFLASTNGLASGNHVLEAISAAICEVVERDAVALWHARPPQERASFHLDLASVDDAGCMGLLEKYGRAGIAVRAWDVTSDTGIPAYLCWIREAKGTPVAVPNTFAGAGCHPDPAVALSRALTEAAQTRLNVIAGVRDDLPTAYRVPAAAAVGPVLMDVFASQFQAQRFGERTGFASDDLAEDVRWELDRLGQAGFQQAIVVDLTREEIGIPVVRVAVPGLEGDCHHPAYMPGARARAMGGAG